MRSRTTNKEGVVSVSGRKMGSKRKCLRLRPPLATVQRVAVYETKTWLYVVGSTNDGTSCHLLKLDRSPPVVMAAGGAAAGGREGGAAPQLGIREVGVNFTEKEVKETLIMLDVGNKSSAAKYNKHGLKQVASAFGIIGFVRFLEGFYIILVTKRKPVCTIGGHVVYKIEDSVIYPITNYHSKPFNPDEAKYLKTFQNVDLSSNFYFSYSYDLTLTLQCQMSFSKGARPLSCRKFIWNNYLLEGAQSVDRKWMLHIIHGFVSQYNISVFGRPIYLTMIARRSKDFAGTRFLKRGANDEGHVANEVETEQIVHDATSLLHDNGRYTSFLQLRGSVPSFWSQDLLGMRPKPQITIDRATPFASPAALHFTSCLLRFGSPVICLNLVKKKEHRKRESLLTDELLTAITYLNQFLPPEYAIVYVHKDMARINKSKVQNLIDILEKIADDSLKETGFFHSGNELYCNKLHPHPDFAAVKGYGYSGDYVGRYQTGVLRVNCVDCLDRTNTAQFIAGKIALGYQLYALGLLSEPRVPFDCDAMRMLEETYEDLGDTLAVQYGGSQLVHRIQTYRKVAPMATHGRDLYQTIHRYYRNAFTDAEKQMAINVFLGVFRPQAGQRNIWELSTDYYLHHTRARVLPTSYTNQSHTKWWEHKLLNSLPLPYYEVSEPSAGENEQVLNEATGRNIDSFDEVYKPFELTDFDSFFNRNITRTSDYDFHDSSPFVVRAKTKKKLPRKAWRGVIVGSPNSPGGDQDSPPSSSDESSGDEDTASQLSSPGQAHKASTDHSFQDLPSTMDVYGFELTEPSKDDALLYERYAQLHRSVCMPAEDYAGETELTSKMVNTELAQWEPAFDYGSDSVFGVAPPVVSPEDALIYQQAVRVATRGPQHIPAASLEMYRNYSKHLC